MLIDSDGVPMTEFQAEADLVLEQLLSTIAPVSKASQYLKVLVYGNPGTRKTCFAASAPTPLLIDIEKGSRSLLNHPELADTAVMNFKNIRQIEALADRLAKGAMPEYKTIIIDTYSELQKKDLDEIVAKAAATDSSRNKFLPTGPDYNINTEHLRQIASSFRDLDRNLIVTCHVKEEKDGVTGRLLVRPNLTPKLASTMAGIFDVVGYMSLEGEGEDAYSTLQVHPTPSITAKTRIGGLPPVLINPTFDMLLAANATNSKPKDND